MKLTKGQKIYRPVPRLGFDVPLIESLQIFQDASEGEAAMAYDVNGNLTIIVDTEHLYDSEANAKMAYLKWLSVVFKQLKDTWFPVKEDEIETFVEKEKTSN